MTEGAAHEPGSENVLLRGALELVELAGVLVVPAHHVLQNGHCSCGNLQCTSPGKHPRGEGWYLRATSDPLEVREMWTRTPDANVGIATGITSGVVVVDIDGEVGHQTILELEAQHGPLPPCPMVRTARGRHLYFAAGDVPLHNRQGARGRGLGKGVDLRAERGFVIAPPSVHVSGVRYTWEISIGELAPPPLPAWIVSMASARPQPVAAVPEPPRPMAQTRIEKWAEAALDRECQEVRSAAEGSRNNVLNKAAFNLGMMVAGGSIDGGLVRRSLLAAALEAGLTEFEALKTIRSGMASGAKKDQRSAPGRDLPMGSAAWHAPAADGGSDEPAGPSEPTVEPTPSKMQPRHNTASLFASLPAQRWAVPGLQLGPGRPTLIAGYGASAKTISVQALALALASGRPIWNHFESTPMVVLHVDYEQGYYATAKRYQRLALGMDIDPRELENRLHYIEMPRVYLDQKGGEDEYLRACEGVDLVIVDALRGVAPHTDENDSAFRAAIDVLTYCSQRTGCSQLLIHHAAKPKKEGSGDARTVARGTSAIYDASGCVMNFVAQSSGAKLVTQVKTPAEAEGNGIDPFELVVEDIAFDGNPTAGARVLWRQPVPVDESAKAQAAFERDAALVMKAVRRVAEGQTANAVVARCGVQRNRALDVLRALADEGRLEVIPKGKAKIYRMAPDWSES